MRVTGGILRGRQIAAPKGRTVRPTQDRVRGALFSALATRMADCRWLDLFAGSGAVGLEAWSRGANFVCWVEQDSRVLPILRRNVEALCGKAGGAGADRQWRVVKADALRFLEHWGPEAPFDIVFADPPYDREDRQDWAGKVLRILATGPALSNDGIVVIEQAVEEREAGAEGWRLVARKTYGGTRLCLYARLA